MFLETKRLKLVDTDRAYLDDIMRVEEIESKKGYVTLWDRKEHLNAIKKDRTYHISIFSKKDHHFVGYLLINLDDNKNMEIMRINLQVQNKGYGMEVLKAIIEYAFISTDTNRLWLDVREHNQRAIYLYKKLGFVEEGVLREAVKFKDGFLSVVVLSILKKEYKMWNKNR